MPNVPNIVRERLKAATPEANHPDADLLTAFAEQSLPNLERGRVLDHLARCSVCRDVVALALPATEDISAASVVPHRGWLTWPALRWALVAAGVVVIASYGVVRYRESTQPEQMSRYAAQKVEVAKESSAPAPVPASAAPEAKRDTVLATPARSEGDAKSGAAAEPKQLVDKKIASDQPATKQMDRLSSQQPAANDFLGSVGGPIKRQISNGPNPPVQWQQQMAPLPQVRMTAPAAPPTSTTQKGANAGANTSNRSQTVTVEVAGEARPVNAEAQDQNSQAQSQDTESQDRSTYSTVGKAKAPVEVETASAAPVTDAAAQQELPRQDGNITGHGFALATTPTLQSRWTISSTGGLQRSFDQGSTWQDVDVNANSPLNLTSLDTVAKTSRAKEKDANKKALKGGVAAPTFRVVTALGSEVWAGGSAGVLYHSADAGSHWTRVLPSAAGSNLSGDIVSLEFSDPQHGQITTATREVWITPDGGQTWQKQ
jgi:hypothetical protein